ncbi:hypothetical protein EDD11_001203 [Mortierella claussenii]|nr:hypothetical protein EDD11_001203 [Mortierella claussenii]
MASNDDNNSASGSGHSSSWSSSLKGLKSIFPGYSSRPDEDNTFSDPDPSSHQVTDYQEGDRLDVDGNIVHLGESQQPQPPPPKGLKEVEKQQQTLQSEGAATSAAPEEALTQMTNQGQPADSVSIPTATDPNSKEDQTIGTSTPLESRSISGSQVKQAVGKAATTLSNTALKRHRNLVLPDYYEQFPDVQPSLVLTVPVGSGDLAMLSQEADGVTGMLHGSPPETTFSGRIYSYMRGALGTVKSLFSRGGQKDGAELNRKDTLQRGPQGIRKVVVIGIHGWFPRKALWKVIGEPTGTSQRFCEEMDLALKDYLQSHNKHLDPEDVTLIPLEGEGKVLDRVEILHQNFLKNQQWRQAVHEADLVLVATHSQGTPTSIILMARWIKEGILRVHENDVEGMQRIGILAMAGISHGPFPFLKGNLIVRWFERDAAGELFEFMDSESYIAKKYREGLKTVLSSGVRLTCVASLEDQVVPLYSAVMTSIHHPSIVRGIYVDGTSYQNDFLVNLIAFSLRLRNTGVDDHGIIVHLSEVIAGSLYGVGHSAIYEEREVYMLSIRSLLEPPACLTSEMTRSEPILNPFRVKQRLNPFYLPWGMRGIADEIMARGDKILIKELERLKKLYNEWNPVTKGMKEIKFRLEPVRSKL